jgi:Ni/Co efflux regulator RcnB
MRTRTMACIAVIASLGFGSLSFAQGHRGRDDDQRMEQRSERRDGRDNDRRDARDRRDYERRDGRDMERGRPDVHYGARGPEWRRGGHVPREYRSRQYVVEDWRGHHLHAPPRGHQWVQVGSDYVLVAIATGVIAQLILGQ